MTSLEIFERLTPIFREVFDNDDVTPHAEMVADDVEEWDSLSHIRLIVSIETAFGVRFSAAEVGGLKKVGDLVVLLQDKGKK